MKAVVLAAGMGTRLGTLIPKPLTSLKNEKTILDYQLERLSQTIGLHNIILVVGYKYHIMMEKFPHLTYVYNCRYTQTNTSKSLLYALNKAFDEDVLWVNGDIFFDGGVIDLLAKSKYSCCLVDNKKCGDEEIKYNLDEDGFIKELSKQVGDASGEALGVNLVKAQDLDMFKRELEEVDDRDYFEKALENLTTSGRMKLEAVNLGDLFCQEIDFPEDLETVKAYIDTIER